MTSGDPLAAGITSGDPLAQPPMDVEGPGVESAAPEVAADAPPEETPAADALVPVVEVPADARGRGGAADRGPGGRRGRRRGARRRRVRPRPPGPGRRTSPPTRCRSRRPRPPRQRPRSRRPRPGWPRSKRPHPKRPSRSRSRPKRSPRLRSSREEAPPELAPEVTVDDVAAQEAAAGVAPPEDAEAREAAAVAEEAAVADAALAESAGAALTPAAASTRAPSGFLDLDALRSAAEGSGLNLPDSVYAGIIAALASGKHLVLAGPAGSGKTTLAVAVAKAAVQAGRSEGAALSTASPKWSAHDTVGRVSESGFTQGHVLSAAGKKKWLIVDEIDRAKLDKAFGDLSSFLGGLPLSLPDGSREIAAPKDWRIVATRDSSAGDPEASAALLRRFAEIRLPRPDAADLDAAIDAATEGDPMAAAVVKRLAADEDLAELGAGPFLDAARHAAERNALSPASEDELEQEIRTAYLR